MSTARPPATPSPAAPSDAAPSTASGRRRPGTVRRLLRRPVAVAALVVLAVVVLTALVSLLWTPYDPMAASPRLWDAPSAAHWFGTDQIGRDVASRVMAGSRVAVEVALLTVAWRLTCRTVPKSHMSSGSLPIWLK